MWWSLLSKLIGVVFQTAHPSGGFEKKFGACRFHTRSVILGGELVEKLCPQKQTCWEGKVIPDSGDSRNFVQGIPISLWKNFGSFQSISSVSGRFGKYQPKFKIWPAWSLCFKKKKVLKTKTNLHFVHWKTSKGKKKMKRKKMNKDIWTINYKFIWNINKIINYYCLVVS